MWLFIHAGIQVIHVKGAPGDQVISWHAGLLDLFQHYEYETKAFDSQRMI